MTKLFHLPVTPASPKARTFYGAAIALTLAFGSLTAGSTALAQETTPQNPDPAAAPANPSATDPATTPDPIVTDNATANTPATDPDAAVQTPTSTASADVSNTPVTATPVSDTPATAQENPYGLKALWNNGDVIARSVLLIMTIMAAGTWIIMVIKFIEQARIFKASRQTANDFWTQDSVQNGAKALKIDSPFRYIAETGIVAAEHHEGSMRDSIDLPSWISMSIQRSVDMINARLQGGLAFLGTVGSTSPFIGLFGTVWGIYHALTAIGITGQASIDKVAGPVGESLIMTAIGLATAVPAVLGYNLLVRRNKAAMDRIRNFAADIHSVLLGGYRHDATFNSHNRAAPTTITTSQRV